MSKLLLALMFYGVVTPIGCIGRWFGMQFLVLKRDRKRETYWNAVPQRPRTKREYASPF